MLERLKRDSRWETDNEEMKKMLHISEAGKQTRGKWCRVKNKTDDSSSTGEG